MLAAIDFGISNTDAVAMVDGTLKYWTRQSLATPDHGTVQAVLAEGGVSLSHLPRLAVT
jgi:hypothetical protein